MSDKRWHEFEGETFSIDGSSYVKVGASGPLGCFLVEVGHHSGGCHQLLMDAHEAIELASVMERLAREVAR